MSELLLTRFPLYGHDLKVVAYVLHPDQGDSDLGPVHEAQRLLSALTEADEGWAEHPLLLPVSGVQLNAEYLGLFDPERHHLLIPERELTAALIEHCIGLCQKGFHIAVSDYRLRAETRRVLFAARRLLVDAAVPEAELRKIVAEAKRVGASVVATGIADHETLKRMRALKVDGYQGAFLTKPDLIGAAPVSSNRLIIYRLMEALQNPDVNYEVLENLLVQDNRLSYKLLKILNSPVYAQSGREVSSVRDIPLILGLDKLRIWTMLIALSNIEDKPYELMTVTMLRAKMAERMAETLGSKQCAMAFMTALLSTLDALLDKPMPDLLTELPVAKPVREALLAGEGELGAILKSVLNYERGQFDALDERLSRDTYRRLYLESVIWASKLCANLS